MAAGSALDGAIAVALADHRDHLNGVVAQARRTHVDFDLATLERQIRGPLRHTVEACDRASSGSGSRVLAALFAPVVDLVGQRRLGGGSHDGLMTSLPHLARVLVEDPRLVFGSLANAIVHLHRYRAPTDEWLGRVRAASASADATTTLRVGQVAAWTLGLSHLRDSALDVAATLGEDALACALGATLSAPAAETVKALHGDRWWRPGRSAPTAPAVVRRVGGFRGFGGPFLAPPRVGARGMHIVVRSGSDAWTLHADAWGATLTRTDAEIADDTQPRPTGVVLPPSLQPSSVATVPDITAATLATSYEVLVVEPGT